MQLMKQLVVNIPDEKINFFKELIRNLGFTVSKSSGKSGVLTEEQIDLIKLEREKIRKDPAGLLDWDEARKNLIKE